uniref:Uncharacterized protein n=1 Tax=Solanum lycopersicum TaxID=4081 RepID=K4AU90_SOLLC
MIMWSTGRIDTGNFVLVGVGSSVLWGIFRCPTDDTLMPTQILEINNKLVARKSEPLFVPDRFYLRMLSDGNLVLVTQSKPTNFNYDAEYYNSHTSNSGEEANSDIGSGVCGFNNVCHLSENQRPYCECPKGYSLIDPNNKYGSCKPKFVPSCDEFGQGNPEDLYDFDVVTDVDWPLSDF